MRFGVNFLSKTAWAFVAAGLLIMVIADFQLAGERDPQELELDIRRSSAGSQLQVFFDTGSGYNEVGSDIEPIAAGTVAQRLIVPLPPHPVRALRLDPLMTEGTVVIAAAKIISKLSRREDTRLDLHRIMPKQEIAAMNFHPNTSDLEIVTTPGSTDSQCLIALDEPIVGGRHKGWDLFLTLLPFDVSLLFIYLLATVICWFLVGQTPAAWVRGWHERNPISHRLRRPAVMLAWTALGCYAWLLLLNMGRSPTLPQQEPSWVAVMTHAIAHRWQFGRDVVLTYGPAMPLTLCSYDGRIDTAVLIGRLLAKAWSLALLIWLGKRLPPGRRAVFWIASAALLAGCSEPACFSVTIIAAGLLLARGERADRWLLAPTLLYVAAIALVKVTFLLYAVLMLTAVWADRAARKQWFAAFAPAVLFAVCFAAEWRLLGQQWSNLPLYFRGSFEMVTGFSQAMSQPPEMGVLAFGLAVALAALAQLALLLWTDGRPRWTDLPSLGLLSIGLLLAWKQGFVRADFHVIDWLSYAMIGAIAAPAFFSPGGGAVKRRLDWACVGVILVCGALGLRRVDPGLGQQVTSMFADRWRSALTGILHPRDAARAQREAVFQNRRLYALRGIRERVGKHTVDVFCDEQAIALLNGLNYRPRPSFLSYSTYTPWLMNLDVAFYCSPQVPDFVLFKLESIDNRLPTLQNAPMLVLLAEYYEQVFTENGYALLQRRGQPQEAGVPVNFPLTAQGDTSMGDEVSVPTGGSIWCELGLRETLVGKLFNLFYQQPPLNVAVTFESGRVGEYRLIPGLASSGFLINPLPADSDEFQGWAAGQPLDPVRSIRLLRTGRVGEIFESRVHYRFSRVPTPGTR